MRFSLRTLMILMAIVAAYFSAYRSCGQHSAFPPMFGQEGIHGRMYPAKWQVVLFQPAGMLESIVRGREVVVCHNPQEPRTMFRFAIRDVLWLMVVVGMGVVLWLEH